MKTCARSARRRSAASFTASIPFFGFITALGFAAFGMAVAATTFSIVAVRKTRIALHREPVELEGEDVVRERDDVVAFLVGYRGRYHDPPLSLGKLLEPLPAGCAIGLSQVVVSLGIGMIERGMQLVARRREGRRALPDPMPAGWIESAT